MSHFTQKNAFQNVARAARKEKLAEEHKAKIAARAANKKRKKELTSTVRGIKVKQRKFKDLKKEILTEARSILKALELQQEKLQVRFVALESLTEKFASMSDSYSSNVSGSDIDLESPIDIIKSVIEEVKDIQS